MYHNLSESDRMALAVMYGELMTLTSDRFAQQRYRRNAEILTKGYQCFYDQIPIPTLGSEMWIHDGEEIVEIFDMFADLYHSYLRLEDNSGIDESDLKFLYFDTETEKREQEFADFVPRMGFPYNAACFFAPVGFNPPMPMMNVYRQMLGVWPKGWKSSDRHPNGTYTENLTKDEIVRMIDAKKKAMECVTAQS